LGTYSKYARGTGHIVDGGNQDYGFFLQHEVNAAGQSLYKYRHWMGPVQQAYENTADSMSGNNASKYCITGNNCVNEPLIMQVRGMTTGWPLYGNANGGYAPSQVSDPEFGVGLRGFDDTFGGPPLDTLGSTHNIARTLPERLLMDQTDGDL
jgi:hypothetical protein